MSYVSQNLLTVNLSFLIQINNNVFGNVMLAILKIQNHIYVKNAILLLIQTVLIVMKKNAYFAKINI